MRQELTGTVGARYRIVRCLGQGGMGAVYEVEDTVLLRRRALKTLLPELGSDAEMRRRFQVEIDALKLIQHEVIVDIVDVGFHPELGFPFLVMDYLDGKNLEELIKAHGTLGAATSLKILTQVASGLDAIHASSVVHRDLKPSNVFIERRTSGLAEVKLLDFGVAKILDTGANNTTLIAGTPGYMSPEQFQGHVDQLTDIYALGKLARVMLCGLGSIAENGPNTVGLPAAFDQWFARATALNKDERFARASLAVEALAAALGMSKRGSSYIEWAELDIAQKGSLQPWERGATEPFTPHPSSSISSISVSTSGVPEQQSRQRQRRVWTLLVPALLLLLTSSGMWLSRQGPPGSTAAQLDVKEPQLPEQERPASSVPSREPSVGSGAGSLEASPGSAGGAAGREPSSETRQRAASDEPAGQGATPPAESGASEPAAAPAPKQQKRRTRKDSKAGASKKPSDVW